jgi:hypothetical protein
MVLLRRMFMTSQLAPRLYFTEVSSRVTHGGRGNTSLVVSCNPSGVSRCVRICVGTDPMVTEQAIASTSLDKPRVLKSPGNCQVWDRPIRMAQCARAAC